MEFPHISCSICGKRFQKRDELQVRGSSQSQQNLFVCDDCRNSSTPDIPPSTSTQSGADVSISCDVCNTTFSNRDLFNAHLSECVPLDRPRTLRDPEISRSSLLADGDSTDETLSADETILAVGQSSPEEMSPSSHFDRFPSTLSDSTRQEFVCRPNPDEHEMTNSGAESFTCDLCNEIFSSRDHLDEHRSQCVVSKSCGPLGDSENASAPMPLERHTRTRSFPVQGSIPSCEGAANDTTTLHQLNLGPDGGSSKERMPVDGNGQRSRRGMLSIAVNPDDNLASSSGVTKKSRHRRHKTDVIHKHYPNLRRGGRSIVNRSKRPDGKGKPVAERPTIIRNLTQQNPSPSSEGTTSSTANIDQSNLGPDGESPKELAPTDVNRQNSREKMLEERDSSPSEDANRDTMFVHTPNHEQKSETDSCSQAPTQLRITPVLTDGNAENLPSLTVNMQNIPPDVSGHASNTVLDASMSVHQSHPVQSSQVDFSSQASETLAVLSFSGFYNPESFIHHPLNLGYALSQIPPNPSMLNLYPAVFAHPSVIVSPASNTPVHQPAVGTSGTSFLFQTPPSSSSFFTLRTADEVTLPPYNLIMQNSSPEVSRPPSSLVLNDPAVVLQSELGERSSGPLRDSCTSSYGNDRNLPSSSSQTQNTSAGMSGHPSNIPVSNASRVVSISSFAGRVRSVPFNYVLRDDPNLNQYTVNPESGEEEEELMDTEDTLPSSCICPVQKKRE